MITHNRVYDKNIIAYTHFSIYQTLLCLTYFNPLPSMLFYLNFHPHDAVSRYRDPQLQVG